MKSSAEISEIFTSIQGEGILLGVKQLFIRFARCNLRCIYCDTPKNSDVCNDYVNDRIVENPVDIEYVEDVMRSVKVHSVSWTGGEPLLYAEFIKNVEKVHPFYLESNMTLPEKAKIVKDVVDYVAGDFKVETALPNEDYDEIFERTVKCFKILKNTRRRLTFCKIVIPEKFSRDNVLSIVDSVKSYVSTFVLQPVFGRKVKELIDLQDELIDVCDVRIIPQVHKYLGLR